VPFWTSEQSDIKNNDYGVSMKTLISAVCFFLFLPSLYAAEEESEKQYGLILGGFSYHWSEEPKDNSGERRDFNEVHNTVGALVRFYEEDNTEIDWAATVFKDSYEGSAWMIRRTWGKSYQFEHVKVVPKIAGMITKKRTSYKDDGAKIFPAVAPMMYVGNEHLGAEFLLFPWFDGFAYVEFEVLF
jgi:hypothetical protein